MTPLTSARTHTEPIVPPHLRNASAAFVLPGEYGDITPRTQRTAICSQPLYCGMPTCWVSSTGYHRNNRTPAKGDCSLVTSRAAWRSTGRWVRSRAADAAHKLVSGDSLEACHTTAVTDLLISDQARSGTGCRHTRGRGSPTAYEPRRATGDTLAASPRRLPTQPCSRGAAAPAGRGRPSAGLLYLSAPE